MYRRASGILKPTARGIEMQKTEGLSEKNISASTGYFEPSRGGKKNSEKKLESVTTPLNLEQRALKAKKSVIEPALKSIASGETKTDKSGDREDDAGKQKKENGLVVAQTGEEHVLETKKSVIEPALKSIVSGETKTDKSSDKEGDAEKQKKENSPTTFRRMSGTYQSTSQYTENMHPLKVISRAKKSVLLNSFITIKRKSDLGSEQNHSIDTLSYDSKRALNGRIYETFVSGEIPLSEQDSRESIMYGIPRRSKDVEIYPLSRKKGVQRLEPQTAISKMPENQVNSVKIFHKPFKSSTEVVMPLYTEPKIFNADASVPLIMKKSMAPVSADNTEKEAREATGKLNSSIRSMLSASHSHQFIQYEKKKEELSLVIKKIDIQIVDNKPSHPERIERMNQTETNILSRSYLWRFNIA